MKKRKWILLAACFVLGWLCGSRMDRGGAGETIVRVETVEETAAQVETAGTQPTGETSRTKQTDEAGTEEWNLVLVNRWNPLDSDPEITLTQLRNGQAVDERCYPDLQEMMDACRAAGLSPLICSSYRTMEDQAALYQAKIRDLISSPGLPKPRLRRWLAPSWRCRGPANTSWAWRWTSWTKITSSWTKTRRTPTSRNGSWSIAGNMASSCAILLTKVM